MQFLPKLVRTILFTSLGLASVSAIAQENPNQAQAAEAATMQQQAATKVSDADLKKFVKANDEIAKLREHYIAKLNEANSQEDAQALQAEVQEKMIAVVNEVGIDAQLYNEIINQLQSDEELRKRLDDMQ